MDVLRLMNSKRQREGEEIESDLGSCNGSKIEIASSIAIAYFYLGY
jgi:hypothetical protein